MDLPPYDPRKIKVGRGEDISTAPSWLEHLLVGLRDKYNAPVVDDTLRQLQVEDISRNWWEGEQKVRKAEDNYLRGEAERRKTYERWMKRNQ